MPEGSQFMKCSNHPRKRAVGNCSRCGKPLCEECIAEGQKETVVCFPCAAAIAAHEAAVGVEKRQEDREEREIRRESRKKSTYLRIFLPIAVIVALLMVGLNVYFKRSMKKPDAFDPNEFPTATMIILDQAIQRYAADHGGTFPENLQAIGKYIDSEKIGSAPLNQFIYNRQSPTQYVLRQKGPRKNGVPEIVMTERGIE